VSEQISAEERERWQLDWLPEWERIAATRRLLAALAAGEALAEALTNAIELIEIEYCSHGAEHGAQTDECYAQPHHAALAAWRTCVEAPRGD
jgi:hypothetical protein